MPRVILEGTANRKKRNFVECCTLCYLIYSTLATIRVHKGTAQLQQNLIIKKVAFDTKQFFIAENSLSMNTAI